MASGAAGDLSQAHLSCAHFSIDKVPLYGLGYRIITLDGDARYWILFFQYPIHRNLPTHCG